MQIWIAESGEYEQRSTDFAAKSPEAALEYLKRARPEKIWTLHDCMVNPRPDLVHWPHWEIRHEGKRHGGDYYDLSEVDLAE